MCSCSDSITPPEQSRPANPYDNASCESVMKTLKREEIYAASYHDLDHLRTNIAASSINTTMAPGFIRRLVAHACPKQVLRLFTDQVR